MTTTTSYGTWTNHADDLSLTVEYTVTEALGSYASDYDVENLTAAYRSAINDALPPSVSLNGSEFYGPYYEGDQHFDGYPLDNDGHLDIKAIIDGIDFWALAAKYDTTA